MFNQIPREYKVLILLSLDLGSEARQDPPAN